jgi:RNA polymerase sigma-70 factor (family 1)
MEDEKKLLDTLKNGDHRAFRLLFEKYYAGLYSFAKLLLFDTLFAEEMVQDVFVEIWEKRNTLEVHTSFKNYLITAVKHKCFNWNQKKINTAENFDEERSDFSSSAASPQLLLEHKELGKKMEQMIEKLPPQAKTAFELKYLEGMSQREISVAMQLSENTVEKHLGNARKHLRRIFHSGVLVQLMLWFVLLCDK